MLLVTLCWVSCDGLAFRPGESSNTPSHFMLQKPDLSSNFKVNHLARLIQRNGHKTFTLQYTVKYCRGTKIWFRISFGR